MSRAKQCVKVCGVGHVQHTRAIVHSAVMSALYTGQRARTLHEWAALGVIP